MKETVKSKYFKSNIHDIPQNSRSCYIVFQISIMMSETQIDLRLFFFFRVKFLPNYKEIRDQKLHRFQRFRGTKAQLTQIGPADVFLTLDVISTMKIVLCLLSWCSPLSNNSGGISALSWYVPLVTQQPLTPGR